MIILEVKIIIKTIKQMKNYILRILLLCIIVVGCKTDKKESMYDSESEMTDEESMEVEDEPMEVTFALESKSGSAVNGEVTFKQEDGKVTMMANLTGLTEGEHAIHIHEKADCSSDDGKSSGGHWNPTGQPHGKWGDEEGYHKGDIGNFNANAEGLAEVSKTTDEWCIGCDDENKNIIGKAIIVHEGVDDFSSQPSGAAGTRVSCGGIIQ